ncbi:SDR family oxidoreductase [Humibacillus xanthopallidus]|uniref:NADP-dependent 3-hydroxy acid dehydrogenase YdfG n=1 Tax=Humibacillus xanthopallidus TaxID=412689 RepID=A0A543HHU8_9MICO|nr:SDR family oxidoreductase [Humibacillus xanthopallidus]TQM57899.1 NADP-dependent 3-hydroxy acid dehydrogenase YdfG [Humibacillus xanthopallidus]
MTTWTAGTVLVTGAASGLGAAVARAVAAEGGRPLVLDRRPPDPEVLEVPESDVGVVDLGDSRSAEKAVRELVGRAGGVDAVVTCAGTDACGRFDEVDGEDWDRVVLVNLLGTAAVIRAALPSLVERHGRVVTVASTLGLRVFSDATAYCASKFGVVGFSRALAVETQGRIGVTTLVPGGMHTAFFDGRPEQYRPGPDAKLNRPEDVAAAVLFALQQPQGCEVRELVVTPSVEGSWP